MGVDGIRAADEDAERALCGIGFSWIALTLRPRGNEKLDLFAFGTFPDIARRQQLSTSALLVPLSCAEHGIPQHNFHSWSPRCPASEANFMHGWTLAGPLPHVIPITSRSSFIALDFFPFSLAKSN